MSSFYLKTTGFMQRLLLIVCLSVLSSSSLMAAIDPPTYSKWSGDEIKKAEILTTEETHWTTMDQQSIGNWGFENALCRNELIFSMALDSLETQSYTASLRLKIKYWYRLAPSGNLDSTTIYRTLKLDYDPNGNTRFVAKSYAAFENGYKIEIEVLDCMQDGSSLTTVPNYLQLESRIEVERYYDFDRSDCPVLNSPSADLRSDGGTLTISWGAQDGAETYELEYTFLDDYDTTAGQYLAKSAISYDFPRQSIRVVTPNTFYDLPYVFDHGYVVFRVRGIGRNADNPLQRQEGKWSRAGDQGTLDTLHSTCYYQTNTVHEKDFNWQYQAVFAEDGKSKEVITYADGSLRGRQAVTRLSTENQSVVQESIFDYHGRPAVQVLPAPTPDSILRYYPKMNLNTSGDPYTWEDFDIDSVDCVVVTPPMKTDSGAARYYSPNNWDKEGAQAFVPDAEGYPFSRTIFTPDNTGRVARQGGVGDLHQPGNKDSRYFYGVPYQEELNRLFGTEVGYAQHYKKNTVIDPNGQASVAYVDAHGRTIATALSGESPDNLDSLASNTGGDSLNVNLNHKNKERVENEMPCTVVSYAHQVTHSNDHDVYYTLTGAIFDDACLDGNLCMECVYDFTLSITDDCGQEMIPGGAITQTIGPLSDLDTTCEAAAAYTLPATTVALPIGEYTITKKLCVNEAAVEYYLDLYLEKDTCLKPLSEFISEAQDTLDLSICDLDSCDLYCISQIGTLDEYLDAHPASDTATYDSLISACNADCYGGIGSCDAMLEMMKADVSPGGQFALYEADPFSASGAYSLLNLLNDLDELPSYSSSPITYRHSSIIYVDEDGTASSIDGTDPNDLSPEDFVENWQDSWADSLVKLHPEYCLYEWCVSLEESRVFDRELSLMMTYADAVAAGYIDSTNAEIDIFSSDPYFDTGGPGASQAAAMQAKIDELISWTSLFQNYTFSMLEVAQILEHCHLDQGAEAPAFVTCLLNAGNPFTDGCTREDVWNYYRILYMSAKSELVAEMEASQTCANLDLTDKRSYQQDVTEVGGIDFTQDPSTLQSTLPNQVADSIGKGCDSLCIGYAIHWYDKLVDCEMSTGDSTAVIDAFIEVCKKGCDVNNPLGASTTPPGTQTASPYLDVSFAQILWEKLGKPYDPNHPFFDPHCNVHLLDMPQNYGHSYGGASSNYPKLDTCGCEMILFNQDQFDLGGSGAESATELFALTYDAYLPNYEGLVCNCNEAYGRDHSGSAWKSAGGWGLQAVAYLDSLNHPVPAEVACKVCTNCATIMSYYNSYAYLDTLAGGGRILSSMMNRELGFNLSMVEYEVFRDSCLYLQESQGCDQQSQIESLVDWLSAMAQDSLLTARDLELNSTDHSEFFVSNLYDNLESCNPAYDADVMFRREYEGELLHFNPTTDSGLVAVGFDPEGDVIVAKQDRDYVWHWGTTLDFGTYSYVDNSLRVYEGSDGSFIMAGIVDSSGLRNLGVSKLNSSGVHQWSYVYKEGYKPHQLLGAVELQNDNWSFAYIEGADADTFLYSTMVLKIDGNGNLQWNKRFEELGGSEFTIQNTNLSLQQMVATSNGDGLYLGALSQTEGGLGILKIQQSGSLSWSKSIPDVSLFCGTYDFGLARDTDNRLAILISDTINTSWHSRLLKLAPGGGLVWGREYSWENDLGYSFGFRASAFEAAADDGLTIAGFSKLDLNNTGISYGYETQEPPYEASFLKVDSLGLATWAGTSLHPTSQLMGAENEPGQQMSLQNHLSLANYYHSWNASCSWQEMTVDTIGFDPTVESLTISAVSPNPTITKTILTPTTGSDTLFFTPDCGEKLKLTYEDECDVDCEVTLELPSDLAGAAFVRLDSLFDATASYGNTFTCKAAYTYRDTTYTIAINGTSTCLDTCPDIALCNESLWITIPADTTSCEAELMAQAERKARDLYVDYIDSVKQAFRTHYIRHCIDSVSEDFNLAYDFYEYHYTLYYYDQAGSLLKTVPPEGVNPYEISYPGFTTTSEQIDEKRDLGQSMVPSHDLVTHYRYNSLGQLIWQQTPDGGESEFWYDRLGRLVVAQNARQATKDYYSYSKYDPLGRVVEAGEIKNTTAMTEATAQDDEDLESWLNTVNIWDRVVSVYDFPCDSTSQAQFPNGKQEHLRGRVACIKYYDESNTLVYATHYSYDIHGNVHTLIQDVPELAHLGQQYKMITYDYDLISGNVEQVNYQPGQADAFYHRYAYDADNRITTVYTSGDSVLWDKDARYDYYQHGPRSRSLIGEEKVQGLDYYYNLQGWLVGVNSNTLHEGRDPGKDGFEPITGMPTAYQSADTDIHATVARDAMGFSLRYHEDDYKSIGTFNNAQTSRALNADLTGYRSLYNGNINHMVTALRDSATGNASVQQTQYHYDQLNRIKQMQVHRASNLVANNSWSGAATTTDYKSTYTYDANGNLQSLIRNGASPSPMGMDSLTYRYLPGTNQLDHVDDGVGASNYASDVDDQDTLNYEYDAIGNLISDEKEEIDEIIWNVGGKIRHIIRTSASSKPDLEFRYAPDGNRYCKIVKPDSSDEDGWQYTYYFRDASGNIMATYQRSYTDPDSLPDAWSSTAKSYTEVFATQEYALYGSERLGIFKQTDSLSVIAFNSTGFDTDGTFLDKTSIDTLSRSATSDTCGIAFYRGDKRFELSNHLGNVLAVISDRKLQTLDVGMSLGHYFMADIWSTSDYHPFGLTMTGRSWTQNKDYRFGFNGKETDPATGLQDYGFRIYNPAIAKFLSVDPLAPKYPWYTPYQFAGNMPIWASDLDGLEPDFRHDNTITYTHQSGGPTHAAKDLQDNGVLASWTSIVDNNPQYFSHITENRYDPNNPAYRSLNLNPGDELFIGYYHVDENGQRHTFIPNNGPPNGPEKPTGDWRSPDFPWWTLPIVLYHLLPDKPEIPDNPFDGDDSNNDSDEDERDWNVGAYHYSKEGNIDRIDFSGVLLPSLGGQRAIYGNGHYFTTIPPEMVVPGNKNRLRQWQKDLGMISRTQLTHRLFGGNPSYSWKYKRTEAFVQIDTNGLNLIMPDPSRPYILMHRSSLPLLIGDRIIRTNLTDNVP